MTNHKTHIKDCVSVTRNYSTKEISRIVLRPYIKRANQAYVEISRIERNGVTEWRAEYVSSGFVKKRASDKQWSSVLRVCGSKAKTEVFKDRKAMIKDAIAWLN